MSDIAFDYTELFLTTPYTAGDLTLDCYAKNDTYKLTDQKTSSLITEFYICGIDRDDETKFMGMKISNVVTNGTWQGATRYTATFATSDGSNPMVALANSYDGTTADANIITALKLSSLKTDSLLLCSVGSGVFRRLEGSFVSATTSETISLGSGEAFAIRSQISLHTDGAYYKYHKTNYPNWVGTAGSAATGAGESFTLRKAGYRVPGYSALTIGGDVFTDNGGTTVQTATTTTKYIGTAHSATEVDLKATAPAGTQLTQVNVEDGTSTAFGEISGERLKQAHDSKLDDVEVLENKKLEDTCTIADSTDNTKEIGIDASGITTGTKRTITMPDADVDLGVVGNPVRNTAFGKNQTSTMFGPAQSGTANTFDTFTTEDYLSRFGASSTGVSVGGTGLFIATWSIGYTSSNSGAVVSRLSVNNSGALLSGASSKSFTYSQSGSLSGSSISTGGISVSVSGGSSGSGGSSLSVNAGSWIRITPCA